MCGRVQSDRSPCGKNYGVDAEFYCAGLSFGAMYQVRGAGPVKQPLPRFPSVNRDIAIVCDASIPVARLEKCIAHAGGDYLKDVERF